jgi:3-deoxy-manno-octulosonate cytidylyltransferase (CMP-KDO synthetase)
MEAGYPIAIDVTEDPTIGVDTPDDAKRFELAIEA